ncbi:MAG: hypothetical protein IPM92_01360 [Saprospiraceae bacterium]|nr:hypothetical protein [Saprospiraceae bacterium]
MNRFRIKDLLIWNGITLVGIGLIGFIANNFVLHTGLTPIISGILFIVLAGLWNQRRDLIQKIGMTLAFILSIAFIWPFMRNLEQMDYWGMLRSGIEIFTCLTTGIGVYKISKMHETK